MKTSRISRRPSILALAAACAFAGQPMSRAIDIAGDLLIELDAADFVNGSSVWTQNYSNRDPDTGILGDFTAFGNPTVQTVGGAMGVLFDGQDYFSGPLSTYLADPIDGPNPTRTIEVWVYQGNIRNEETLVSWGRRGAEGRNLSFNYGRSTGATGFGAVGQWGGGPDLGWNPGGVPAAGEWHHLVYTFGDGGSITKVYVDGLLAVSESTSVDTFPEYSINLGIQRSNSEGFPLDVRSPDVNNVLFSGAIGKVRIHSGALTDVEVLNNFEAEKSLFTAGVTASDVTRSPILRWSFNEASGDAFDGTSMLDEITGVSATIRGAGAIFTGSGVDLPGGNPNLQGYIDLPNGILSGKEALSIELWYTPQSRTGWSRVFDFGSGTGGEIGGPGGSFTAQNAVFLTQNSADTENQRLARRDGTEIYRDALGTTVYGEEVHVVMTYNPVVQEWQWYRNGILQEVVPDAAGPRTLADLNNWLGRSNFGTDQNTDAIYNEFRVYNYTLSESEILGNYAAGADTLNAVATTLSWTPRAGGTFAFNNAGGQDNWNTGEGGAFPNAVDVTATIVGDFTGPQTIELNAPITVGLLAFGDTDQSEAITIAAGTGGSLTFQVSKGTAAIVQSSGSAGDTITAPLVFASQTEVATYSTNPLVITGPTSGEAGLTKSGPGTVVLLNNNGYLGATRVQGGILQVGDGGVTGTLPSGGIEIGPIGTLVFNRSDAYDVANSVTGRGALVHEGSGELTLSGSFAHTGQTRLLGGPTNITGTIAGTNSLLIDNDTTLSSGSVVSVGNYFSVGVVDGGSVTVEDGATLSAPGDFNVGDVGSGNGVMMVEGGTVNFATLYVGKNSGTQGFVFQSGGTVQRLDVGNDGRIGGGVLDSNAYGYYGLTGGTLTTNQNFQIGAYGFGIMDIDGGTMTSTSFYPVIARFGTGHGVMNVSSGSFAHTSAGHRFIVAEGGRGVLNVSGPGSVTALGGILTGTQATSAGVINLNGGTIEAAFIRQADNGSAGAGWGEINFNGGTLRATGDNATFLQGLDAAYVRSGGAVIDPDGHNITINQPLLAPTGDGVISIPVLDGGEGYLAAPMVQFSGGDGTGVTAVAEVSGGVVTGITITNPGVGYTVPPSVSLVGGGASIPAQLDSASLAPNATTGGVTFEGAGSVTLTAANTYQGPTTVTESELVVTGSLAATASVEVNGNGVLRLGNTEVINDLASVKLSGGTLATEGFSEKLGTLSIELGATIDLGAGLSTLTFDDSSSALWSGSLTILNWSGLQAGNGDDRIFFGNSASGLTEDQLQLITFLNPGGMEEGSYGAEILPTGEIVPIPEPTGVAMLALGMATVVGLRRRRSKA